MLILGTGSRTERINPKVLALLKKKGIAVEVQDTVMNRQHALKISKYSIKQNIVQW
jgi:uncharacterized protein